MRRSAAVAGRRRPSIRHSLTPMTAPASWNRDTLPEGDEKRARGARDVRRHRPALRPRQPDHDVPPRRALAAPRRARARPARRAAGSSTWPAAPATCASTSPGPGYRPISVDLSLGMLRADRSGAPRVQADILRLPVPDGSRRRRDVRVRPAQPRRPGGVLRRARPGRAPGRPHRPARRRHPPQPARALGPRHLLRQGGAAHRRLAVRPGGLPLPAAQRRLPAAAGGDGGDAARGRVRRRRAPRAVSGGITQLLTGTR